MRCRTVTRVAVDDVKNHFYLNALLAALSCVTSRSPILMVSKWSQKSRGLRVHR